MIHWPSRWNSFSDFVSQFLIWVATSSPEYARHSVLFFLDVVFLSEQFWWIMLITSFFACFKTWDPKDPAKFPCSNSSFHVEAFSGSISFETHQQKESSWHLKPWTRLYDFLDDCGSFWSRISLKQLPFPTAVDWWCRDFVCFCEFTLVNLKKVYQESQFSRWISIIVQQPASCLK